MEIANTPPSGMASSWPAQRDGLRTGLPGVQEALARLGRLEPLHAVEEEVDAGDRMRRS
jgi:hypothetical protein